MIKGIAKERREAYVEVLEVLSHMEIKYTKKIPDELMEFFKENSSPEYKFSLVKGIPFEEQSFKKITINILAMLNLNYWCEDEEHKKYLLNKYHENELKYQEEIRNKYSTDKLFKRERKIISLPIQDDVNNLPQYYNEEKWYVKIYEIISENLSKFLRMLFNKY